MKERPKRRRTIKSPPKARPERQKEIREAVAKLPPKRTFPKQYPKESFGSKVADFFFPKHFGSEVAKGMHISSPYGCAPVIFGLLYKLGKLVRRVVDPKRKMFGQGEKDDKP